MNPFASLNLANHDDGIAAITSFPVALDWLSISMPPSPHHHQQQYQNQHPYQQSQPQPQPHPHPQQQQHRYPKTTTTAAASSTTPLVLRGLSPSPSQHPAPNFRHSFPHQPSSSSTPPQAPLPASQHHPSILPHIQVRPAVTPNVPASPPFQSTAIPGVDIITKRQASSALVRHVRPYGRREVYAPCFCIGQRFILGKLLGALHTPIELGLSHLVHEKCSDARFVLDLRFGSIVEIRHYFHSNVMICVGYTSKNVEYITISPSYFPNLSNPNTNPSTANTNQLARVEINYQRDNSVSPMTAPRQQQSIPAPSQIDTTSNTNINRQPNMLHGETIPLSVQNDQQQQQFYERGEHHQQQQQDILRQATVSAGHLDPIGSMPLQGNVVVASTAMGVGIEASRQWMSWQDFSNNYGQFFPTGPLIAMVSSEQGASIIHKKESIIVTLNDGYAMSFTSSNISRTPNTQARRIAPKRLLPRPTP